MGRMKSSTRIIVNTSAQFAKTFLGGIITLYSSRLILLGLGECDFGIYSLVAGIILMLSFITNALATSTQRYLSFYHHDRIKTISFFSNSFFLNIVFGFFAVIVLLSLIPLLFNGFLNISLDRINAAKIIYITVVSSVYISFITSPFRAVLISYENIVFISLIEFLDIILKLVIAFSLDWILINKLEYYGYMLLGIQILNFACISVYTSIRYKESTIVKFSLINKNDLRQMTSFAGWNMYVLGCNIGRTQGLSVVLNKFLGTIANAAYGIGLQLSSYVNYMSESLLNAFRPQIMKAEGRGERSFMFNLSCTASKFSFFILTWISVPAIIYMPEILDLWLKEPPDGSVVFCRMFLLAGVADSLTIGLHTSNQAIGNLKRFVLVINTSKLAVLPLSIVALWYNKGIIVVSVIYVGIELLTAFFRVVLLSKDGLIWRYYYSSVIYKVFIPISLMVLINLFMFYVMNLYLLWSIIISLSLYALFILLWGLTAREREILFEFMGSLRKKFDR